MREGFRFDNLFKLNKKPPEIGGQGGRLVYEEEKTTRHKSHQATAIVLVFLLGFIVTFGFVKKQAFIKEQPLIKLEKKADYVLAEIAGLAKVDSTRAMELGLDLKRSVEDSRKNIGDKQLLKRLESLQQKLDSVQSELGFVRQAKLSEFLDPNLLTEEIRAKTLAGNNESLLVFDDENNILATVSPVDRSGQVIGGGIEGIKSAALGRNSAFGIIENRIIEFPFNGGEPTEAVKEDGPWGADSILFWFGGNLYVLDKSVSEVLKYQGGENNSDKPEFGSRRQWFKPGLNFDLSDAVATGVDGDIWVLHQGGRISRFRNGSRIYFRQVLTGFMSDPILFSVPQEGEKVWVLGRKDKKVTALNRETGEFAGLWEAEEFGKAQGLVVNEKLGKMFVLVEGKIYVANTQ
ncbi:hypothetical protein HYU89_01315 [Candidatus Collierbacteria bacterium]|nr:hypothetical protein [Candidatus Collierbacteria bacterium]